MLIFATALKANKIFVDDPTFYCAVLYWRKVDILLDIGWNIIKSKKQLKKYYN